MRKKLAYSIALALMVQGADLLLGPEHTDNLAVYLANSILRLPTSIVLATSLRLRAEAFASFVMDYYGWINLTLWTAIFLGVLTFKRTSQATNCAD